MTYRPARRTNRQPPTIPLIPTPIPKLRRLINKLIERGKDIIRELYFGDGGAAHGGVADAETGDSLFAEGGVEDAGGAEFFAEADGATEDTAEGYVFAEGDLGGGRVRGGGE